MFQVMSLHNLKDILDFLNMCKHFSVMKRKFHDYLTLVTSMKKLLSYLNITQV